MTVQWYFGRGADITGPLTGRQLSHLAASGDVLPSDTVWQEGVEMGVRAGKVRNLFRPASAPAAPPNAPSQPLPGAVPAYTASLTPSGPSEASSPDHLVELVATASAAEPEGSGSAGPNRPSQPSAATPPGRGGAVASGGTSHS
jgi:GYF domain 2